MECQSVSNWLKLNLLLDQAQTVLQRIFLRSWKAKFGQEWDLNSSAIILDSEQFQGLPTEQRKAIQEAEVRTWDLTILKAVLTAKNVLCLPMEQEKKILQILSVRNKVTHFPNKLVPEKQFNELWNKLQQILIFYGVPDSDLQQLKQGHQLGGVKFMSAEEGVNEAHCSEAAKLKEKGNEQFRKGDYLAALQLFSQGIDLPGLRVVDRATLYSNRCTACLMLYRMNHDQDLLHKGEEDAKKAIELRPEWWRGHFRLGKIYAEAEKYKKAELSFNEALTREPQSQETIDALSDVRWRCGQHSRMDYLDAGNIATSSMDYFRRYQKTTGVTLDVETLMKRSSLKSGDPQRENLRNCILGYQYRGGLDGFPRNVQLAVKHYKIAADGGSADGMFNLATMMLNGEGMEKDFVGAVSLLRNAAAQPPSLSNGIVNCGVAEAEHQLALCYEAGIGVNKNIVQAICWYQRSSDHGCSNAANNLGLIYQYGVMNTKPDLVKAEQLYKSAIKPRWGLKPNSYAMLNVALLHESKGDYERSLKWCHRAKENGNIHPNLDELMGRLNERMQLFAKSGIIEWEKQANKRSDGLTLRERDERFLRATQPDFSLVADSIKLMADKFHLCGHTTLLMKTKFEADELEKCAAYSVYGRNLWKAKQHFSSAVYIMLTEIKDHETLPVDVCEVFIEHLSCAVEIETIIMEFLPSWQEQAVSIVKRLLKRKTAFDRGVRVCYAALQALSSLELTVQFLNGCLHLYPKDCFFLKFRACLYAFLQRFEDGMHDINLAVSLKPHNFELLYDRAGMMKQLVPKVSGRAVIDAYKVFLSHAPQDHRKYPEGYYSIATLEEDLSEVKKYYELGLAAEEKQLSFFLPYESNCKALTEFRLTLSSKLRPLSETNSSPTTYKPQVLETKVTEPKDADFSLKLSDPNRAALIKRHRTLVSVNRKYKYVCAKFSFQPPNMQTAPQSLLGLTAISLEDMDPNTDHVYKGCAMTVTIIDEPGFTGSSIALVLEDTNGDVERCCIYNSPHMEKETKVREVFGPGRQMSIINPYFRIAADGMSVIRVDDPSTLVMEGCIPSVCRYCTKPKAAMVCSRCKNALYCNKSCQKLDWKTFKHKLICNV